MLPVGADGVPGGGRVGTGVRSLLCRVEVHLFVCVSSLSAVPSRCSFGMEGSQPSDLEEALPGDYLLQPSPFHAQDTQHPASALLGPWGVVS